MFVFARVCQIKNGVKKKTHMAWAMFTAYRVHDCNKIQILVDE